MSRKPAEKEVKLNPEDDLSWGRIIKDFIKVLWHLSLVIFFIWLVVWSLGYYVEGSSGGH